MSKPCAHCWHVHSSTTNGLAVEGYDSIQCCHCGRKATRDWEMVPDPAHGPYMTHTIRREFSVVYEAKS